MTEAFLCGVEELFLNRKIECRNEEHMRETQCTQVRIKLMLSREERRKNITEIDPVTPMSIRIMGNFEQTTWTTTTTTTTHTEKFHWLGID